MNASRAEAISFGEELLGLACDATGRDACQRAVDAVPRAIGCIDILINNAGITHPVKTMEIDPTSWSAIIDVNLREVLYPSQSVIPHMRQRENGVDRLHVVGLCAAWRRSFRRAALRGGQSRRARFGQSHGARTQFRRLPRQLRRVGRIQTDITSVKLTEATKTEIIKGIPLSGLGEAREIANIALLLASDLSAYGAGAVIGINEGMLVH